MTRCLNCGSPRETDLCAECGLETSAAEFSLRKKLLNRTAIFLLGSIAFVVAALRYPALDLDGILIFMGVLFFITLALAMLVERGALRHAEVENAKRIYFALIPVPWLLAGLLLVNGAFDASPVRTEPAHVVGKFSMPGPVPSRRLIVTSWREGHKFERIAVGRDDFDRFNIGDAIEIRTHEGLASIPWVSGVSTP